MKMSEFHAERSTEQMLEDEVCSLQRQLRETATLRDHFAMAALTALLQRPDWKDIPCEGITKAAYIYADEMMAAREAK